MPSCRIYVDSKHRDISDADLERFDEVIVERLRADGEHAVVVIVPTSRVNLSGCYVELTCRQKPTRTPELLQELAAQLDQLAREVFDISEPVRVRVIKIEEDLLAGVN